MTGSRRVAVEAIVVALLACHLNAVPAVGDEVALRLRATAVGARADALLSIELLRWSTEAERSPLLAALSPATPPASAPAPAGRAGGRGSGRGGRGGREGAAPPNPMARLSAAIKAAPTVGFIWRGITGYSIKYAWHAATAERAERVVLVTDRRLDAVLPEMPRPEDPPSAADLAAAPDFTVVEILIDAKGIGEGKTAPAARVVVDAAAQTLAVDNYRAVQTMLKVVR